jgi:DNA-binding transcriptional ArsR family regulator
MITYAYIWPGVKARFQFPMSQRASLSPEAIELIARRFAVLAEPMRLRLIHALFAGEKNVNTLVAEIGGTQANISRHLQTLTQAHVLARRKEGLQVFYSIGDPSIFQLCELVCGSLAMQHSKQAVAFAVGPRVGAGHRKIVRGE